MRRHLRTQAGYTLIELVVAMAIFSVVLVVAIGGFINVSNSSLKAGAQRKVQQDIRFNLEEIARQTRASQIDYAFYQQAATDARCNTASHKVLAMIYTESERGDVAENHRLFFYHNGTTLYKYDMGPKSDVLATPTCTEVIAAAGVVANKMNADTVEVTRGDFYITPAADPYSPTATDAVKSVHPRVTIVATVRTGTIGGSSRQTASYNQLTVQTTISSRSYPIDTLYGQ